MRSAAAQLQGMKYASLNSPYWRELVAVCIEQLLVQGVDFYFSNRAHAQKFVDFLQSVIPIRFRSDKQLVSHNIHTSSYNYKYTYSVDIVPICRVSLIARVSLTILPSQDQGDGIPSTGE